VSCAAPASKTLKNQLLFNVSNLADVPGSAQRGCDRLGEGGICGAHDRLFLQCHLGRRGTQLPLARPRLPAHAGPGLCVSGLQPEMRALRPDHPLNHGERPRPSRASGEQPCLLDGLRERL
jgi:hypothetical protein